ncbi:hypothetical protein IW140_006204 [Coemansia sp. RSA 1813]|nr:hypothetical protein EV178_006214 [Coemansia sp. RSA 1646]KAJ1766509.1 hypothetical protein LPJ74_005851 [Coemansia sp. RSA 1843]KAJ2085651.1 hypothetical protein IW138_006198 [Coemansia sp. RSA 986]KAJ2210544.1 hypothetical protein EV179_006168 [Coemansia sp. RSA 487]KAJ2563186.1 hypothetical protein IW140_006204 [Coemansia sp. RSA 1813]
MTFATAFIHRVLNRPTTVPPSSTDAQPHAGNIGPNTDSIVQANNYISSDFVETPSSREKGIPVDYATPEKDSIQDIAEFENQALSDGQEAAQLPRNAGFLRSFSSIVCIIIGTGSLQIPYAFAKTGWIGVIFVVLSALIGSYTGALTIRCLYYQPGMRLHSFPQIGRAAFGPWGQYAAQFFASLYSLGTTCLYIILAGQFIHGLVITLGVGLSQKVWMVIVAVIMWIPVAIMKEMSEAAILAIFGLLASVVVIVISTVMSLVDPYTKMHPADPAPDHSIAIGIGIPVALSSIVFSFSGNVVYPHVEASMKKPRQWPMVVLASMVFSAAAYLLIGITGYWAYGDQVVSPVLDSIPTGAPATVAKIMITLHVIIAAPILLLSFYLEIEKQWNITAERLGKKREFIIRLAYRSVVVAIVCGISLAIPYFSDFLSLISSLACVTMYAIIPVTCYLKLYGHRVAPWYEKIWMAFVLAISAVACVWGSIDAIRSLIKDAQGN